MSAYTSTWRKAQAAFRFLSSVFLTVLFFTSGLSAAETPKPGEKGSTFTAQLINIEAAVHEGFRYNTTLHNGSSEGRIYELTAAVPDGWNVVFRARGSQLTSINVDGNKDENINVEVHPAFSVEPAKYKIPVTAAAPGDTLRLTLEAVVRGAYGIELTTPTGLLSGKITEGKQKQIHLVVRNTGTLALSDISLSAQTPANWDATFAPDKVEHLDPGKTADVVATLSVPDKTIAGDYLTTFTAKSNTGNAQATFRMTVRTSMLSGWIGILVIGAAIALVYFLIRKYGRR